MLMFYVVRFVLSAIVVNFVGSKFSWISLSFLSMIIYEVLYTWCLSIIFAAPGF